MTLRSGECLEGSPFGTKLRCVRGYGHDGDHVGYEDGRMVTWGPPTWGPSLAGRYLNDAVFHRLVDALAAQIREGVLAQRDVVQAAELLAAIPVPLCYYRPATPGEPANERTAPDQWLTAEALGAAVSAGQVQRAGTNPPPRTTKPAFDPPGQAPRGETRAEFERDRMGETGERNAAKTAPAFVATASGNAGLTVWIGAPATAAVLFHEPFKAGTLLRRSDGPVVGVSFAVRGWLGRPVDDAVIARVATRRFGAGYQRCAGAILAAIRSARAGSVPAAKVEPWPWPLEEEAMRANLYEEADQLDAAAVHYVDLDATLPVVTHAPEAAPNYVTIPAGGPADHPCGRFLHVVDIGQARCRCGKHAADEKGSGA